MGATSVTGIGAGQAYNQKGPGNKRNEFSPQVGPRIVAAGAIVTGNNIGTVTYPTGLDEAAANYIVTLNVVNGAGNAGRNAHVTAKNDTLGKFTSFDVYTEVASEALEWVVMHKGYCVDVHV
jgi:hypothetical protein